MNLIINGEARFFDAITNVAQLIDKLGIKGDRVAVELNREIVLRAQWTATPLKDGDKLEIVHFVGGGSTRMSEQPKFTFGDTVEVLGGNHKWRLGAVVSINGTKAHQTNAVEFGDGIDAEIEE